ncbi:unnamed protein product [Ambrosiozyma monospora]|uniref:Unnamed protein product n=1 Tax=Ambrosiozyma monospora TaxID=43982 RepID=A0A9W7DIE2_AMBMO|nr:unnamed protein product [Ambrosiozyma monospora]
MLAKLKIDLLMAGPYSYLIPPETEANTSFRKYLDESKWVIKKDIKISRFGTQIEKEGPMTEDRPQVLTSNLLKML